MEQIPPKTDEEYEEFLKKIGYSLTSTGDNNLVGA